MPSNFIKETERRHVLKGALGALAALTFPRSSLASGKATPVIAIDPGHGGHDSGAIGRAGTMEKELALKVALKLRDKLSENSAYKLILTRDADVFVPLIERVRFAQINKAHLLISLHADALQDSSVRGASVYRLAPDASDAQTAELSANHNSEISTGPRGAPEYPPGVSAILENLMFREKQVFSFEIQNAVVKSLDARVRLLNNPARHGHFLVLRSGRVPSLLLEMGFMSNEHDERLLVTDDYQQTIVASLCEAIDGCIDRFAAAASSSSPATDP